MEQRGDQAAPVALEAAQQAAHTTARHLRAEVPGGDVLEVMRLVEHDPLVRRQHRRFLPVVAGLAHLEVGREQVMVHHHHVGLRRLAPRAEHEAAVEVLALEPGTEVGLGAHLVPHLRARRRGQVAQRAIGGAAGPRRPPTVSSSSLSGSSSVRCAPTAWCSRARQR